MPFPGKSTNPGQFNFNYKVSPMHGGNMTQSSIIVMPKLRKLQHEVQVVRVKNLMTCLLQD